MTNLVKEIRIWFRDVRNFLFSIPHTKYQFWDKVVVIGLIVFPLILMFLIIFYRG